MQQNKDSPSQSVNKDESVSAVPNDRKVSQELAAKRRERPPLRYTEDFTTPSELKLDVIGVVRSPYKVSYDLFLKSNLSHLTLFYVTY